MSNASRTFYIKIEGFGELSSGSGTGSLYRFTTRTVDADDVPILLDVPGRLSSSIQPLRPIGSDSSVKFRLAYEASGHEDKVRPLVEDQSRNRFIYGGGTLVQLTKGIDPSETDINLTTTTGLSTDKLYYLGGEAVSISTVTSSTEATVSRGELSLDVRGGAGMYHTADQGLGPTLTTSLPSPVGMLVEYGYVGGSAPLFTGRIRDVKLIDGVYIDISAVAVSSIAREMEFLPPQGALGREFRCEINIPNAEVTSWGEVLIESGKYARDSNFTGAPAGFVHFVHEDGRFATFRYTGFSTTSNPNYLKLNMETGNSLVMVGDNKGLICLSSITFTRLQTVLPGLDADRLRGTPYVTETDVTRSVEFSAYSLAYDLLNKNGSDARSKLRFEIAVHGDNLQECLQRVLSSPQFNVAGLSAGIPSGLVSFSIESSATAVTNTLSSSSHFAFILPPTEAKRESAGVFRQRKKTILNTLKDTLSVFSLSLVCETDGSLRLVDWTTYFEPGVDSFSSGDLSSISCSMAVEENRSAPIVALIPPTPDAELRLRRDGGSDFDIIDLNVDTQLIKSTRPVTSAQIRAVEAIETKYAIGDKATLEHVARPMTETRVDKFGIPRPEFTFSVHSSTSLQPGDSFTLTHPDLPAANGSRGLSNVLCVALEVGKDTSSGVTTIKALAIDRSSVQRAKWAPAGVVVSVSGSDVTIEANVFTDSDAGVGPTTDAEAFELDLPSKAQLLDSTGAFRVNCEISSRSGNVLTVINLKGVVPAAGDIITLAAWNTTSGEWASFTGPPAYGADLNDTLGTSNDDAQVYS